MILSKNQFLIEFLYSFSLIYFIYLSFWSYHFLSSGYHILLNTCYYQLSFVIIFLTITTLVCVKWLACHVVLICISLMAKDSFMVSLIPSQIRYRCVYQHSNPSNGNKYIVFSLTAFIISKYPNNKIAINSSQHF